METAPRDFFDRARAIAAAIMLAAGAAALLGSFSDWVTIQPPEVVPENQAHRLEGFSGVETSDGWVIVACSAVLIACSFLVLARRKAFYGWLAFLASMFMGSIAIADYRGIEQLFYDEMERIGDPAPAFGLLLVAAAGFIGVIAGVIGAAASPHDR